MPAPGSAGEELAHTLHGEPRAAACALLKSLQLLPGLKPHCLPRRNGDLGPGAGIPADTRFARPDVEDAEAAEFDALSTGERSLHTLKDGFHGHLRFRFGDAGAIHHFVDNIELDQAASPLVRGPSVSFVPKIPGTAANLMIGLGLIPCQGNG